MHFRKFISIWALLALIVGQIALAQHSVTHIDHGFSLEQTASYVADPDHSDHQDHQKNKHECPEYLLTKLLQTAFYNAQSVIDVSSASQNVLVPQQIYVISSARSKAHSPRAPPVTLI